MSDKDLVGVKGWLLFLVIWLGVLSLLGVLISYSQFWLAEVDNKYITTIRAYQNYKNAFFAIVIISICIRIYAAYKLYSQHEESSVTFAKYTLWITGPIASAMIAIFSLKLNYRPLFGENIKYTVINAIFALIWTLYLNKSDRVYNTYSSSAKRQTTYVNENELAQNKPVKESYLNTVNNVSQGNSEKNYEPMAEAKPSTPKQSFQPQQEAAPLEPERKTTPSPLPIGTVDSGNSGGGSGGKWILGIIGVIFVIWLTNSGDQSNKKPSYSPPSSSQNYSYPQSTPAPAVQTPSTTQSASPSGSVTNNSPNVGSDQDKKFVQPFVRSYQTSTPAESLSQSESSAQNSLNHISVHDVKIVQQLLTDIGYDPGQVDGVFGEKTKNAIVEFQRKKSDYVEDGMITYSLIKDLRILASMHAKRKEVQKLLSFLGYDPGPIDGAPHGLTTAAIIAFERSNGVFYGDGRITDYLISDLRKAVSKQNVKKQYSILMDKPSRSTSKVIIDCGEGFVSTPKGSCKPLGL